MAALPTVPAVFALFAQSDFSVGDLVLGAPAWVVPAAVVAGLIFVLVLWNYSSSFAATPPRVVAGLLKTLAIGLLAICLLQPMRSGTRPRPQANILPILVDNSQSMQLKTTAGDETRGDKVLNLLKADSDWRVRLAQAFDVRDYAFDARLERIDSTDELSLDGYVSSLAGSLQSLSERFTERPVAAVMLFTDGNLTDLPPADFDWTKLGFPVYPVLPEEDDEIRDLRISGVSVRQTDFESAPTTVRVQVEGVAFDDAKVFVQLRDQATGIVVEEKSVTLNADKSQEVRFRFRPEKSGISFYHLAAFTEDDRQHFQSAKDAQPETTTREATLANNRRTIVVNRVAGPYRILYVAGRPNWEFKFLRRALEEDAEVQLVGLLRIANKEPKFSFRDRGVTTTNPLFQGLGDADEEAAQQYDEPVIIRLGVKESEELSDGFPESAEELFAYHGVILDDIEAEFFSQDQLLLLRRFVGSRGGGLLMLGGQESFSGKGFADGPLGELAPVYPPRQSDSNQPGAYRLAFTREGMLQPWVRLRDNELAEKDRLKEMPAFTTVNRVGDIKPGASLLATATDTDGRAVPALVAQRFGKGRTAALATADTWRWSMRRQQDARDDPAQAWRQITHWLVNEVPRRAELRVDASRDPSQPVTIVATARDQSYLAMDNATVELQIQPLAGDAFTINAEPHEELPGVYSSTYWARDPGGYRVTAKMTAADGSHIGEATSGWTVQTGAAEFSDLRLNRSLLERIAKETGGELIRDDQLDQFAGELPNRKVPVTETWVYPIWHRPWVMGLAMLCLCLEWGIRRWKGLA